MPSDELKALAEELADSSAVLAGMVQSHEDREEVEKRRERAHLERLRRLSRILRHDFGDYSLREIDRWLDANEDKTGSYCQGAVLVLQAGYEDEKHVTYPEASFIPEHTDSVEIRTKRRRRSKRAVA